MKVALLAPSPVPFTRGGAERAVMGLARAINEGTNHDCEVVKLPVDESNLVGIVNGYQAFAALDLGHFDQVISVKYPAWITAHHDHRVLMFHPLRGLYDTYHLFGLPEWPSPQCTEFADLIHVIRRRHDRAILPEMFERFYDGVRANGADHPDLAFPGPLAREIVQWLDLVALAPAQVRHHFALSRTVASRPGYFPAGVTPGVVYLPSDLGPLREGGQGHVFTASRLDGPKRLDLLVRAMAHVPVDIPLLIAGTGPEEGRLRALAAADRRVRFLGFVEDRSLIDLYADALAVAFVPEDEDYGLITLEAMGCATPVVTCHDSGGPTELVADGMSGLVTEPDPAALGAAITRLARRPELATTLGQNGRRRASRVTWPDVVHTLLGDHRRSSLAARSIVPPESAAGEPASRAARPAVRGPKRRRKVVVTATFPVHPPRGGGQLRCLHLYGALARHAEVEIVCLVDPLHPAGTTPIAPGMVQTLVPRSPAHMEIGEDLSISAQMPVTDIVAATDIWATPAYLDALRRAAQDASALLLAEPYLLPAIEQAGVELPFVYDAFNVEADLKAAALPRTHLGRELLAAAVDVERRAMEQAAAVTACSSEDADALATLYGRSRADILVIPNGTDTAIPFVTPEERRDAAARWMDHYALNSIDARRPRHLALFFASWHPPNIDAAELVIDLAPQLPDVLFLLAGSHGEAFRQRVLPSNVVFSGVVAQRAKAVLLGCVDVALNPMRTGSGTNLKVIEYLATGVPAVSTPFGVRGLDVVAGVHLLIAPPDGFATAIRTTVDDPVAAHERAGAGRALAREFYDWSGLGDRLATVVADVMAGRRGTHPAVPTPVAP